MNIKIITVVLSITITLTTSIKFDCSYSDPHFYWATLGHTYTCDGKVTEISDSKHLKNVFNDHHPGKNNDYVHGLLIVHQRELTYFPQGIQRIFQNLKAIDMEGCGIITISRNDLEPFTKLVQLSLEDNKLVELPHDLFFNNLHLRRLEFEGNQILHIGHDIFKPLKELTTVFMRYNTCTSEYSTALRRDFLETLEWELLVECPPTLSMLSKALVGSKDFIMNLKTVTEKSFNELRDDMLLQINDLEEKVRRLKSNI